MRVSIGRFVPLAVIAAAIASPTFAVNLVNNPSFAGSTAGWTLSSSAAYDIPSNVIYDPTNDATGTRGSGSAKSTYVASGASTQLAFYQCIAAGPGNYTLGGKILIPSGQAIGGDGVITVEFLPNPTCPIGGNLPTGFYAVGTATTGSFQTVSAQITAPAGTKYIFLTGENHAAAAGTHVVNFDDFVLDNGVSAAIPALGPLGQLALIAAIAATGFFVLRR